ncbi:MAG TPA: hypothetical protein VNM66_04905, partial [Thermodesulfobacteriota bacterium]|nr:hypothetical protein [Thermodesulfobacteriota bacterium]
MPGQPPAERPGPVGPPRPEDFGLGPEEVERIEARHDLVCRRLVSVPLAVAVVASAAAFVAICERCTPPVALLLALALLALFMTFLGLGSAIAVYALYPVVARCLSERYRAVSRFREAEERYR